ncbi:MAG: ribonuclease P protein component 4 [Candidatus Micrarchaeia archaeon]
MQSKSLARSVASERIVALLGLAERAARDNTQQSRLLEKRYVRLAKLISAHYKVKISKELKQRLCKKCDNFLVPGVNCVVRIASSRNYVVYKCECGAERHIPYSKPTIRKN